MREDGAGGAEGTRSGQGRFALVVLLVVVLLAAASGYLFLPEEAATLLVLVVVGILSTIGVVALFAGAAGILGWTNPPELPAETGGRGTGAPGKYGGRRA